MTIQFIIRLIYAASNHINNKPTYYLQIEVDR